MEQKVAAELLKIKAVFLQPENPFLWASGIHAPIYCDNRLVLSYPKTRNCIEMALIEIIRTHYPTCECIMGTSTAGIAHAAIVAEKMGLPMGYVRSGAKDHGRENQIEGKVEVGQKIVVIEDLISTAGSVIEVVKTLRNVGADVLGVASIFNYGMQKSVDCLQKNYVKNVSASNYDVLLEVAVQEHYIDKKSIPALLQFRSNPSDASWMKMLVKK